MPVSNFASMPTRDECVLRTILDGHTERTPDGVFAVDPNGDKVTYGQLRHDVRSLARGLQDIGVKQGDHVVVWMPNTMETIRVWFAINYIGAVYVPINTSYRGGILEHVIRNSAGKVLIGHPGLVDRLRDIDRAAIETIVVAGEQAAQIDGVTEFKLSDLSRGEEPLPLESAIEPWHTQSIIYTSGTTGPSKGVLSSYSHLLTMAKGLTSSGQGVPFLGPSDRFMINLPLFHVGGTCPVFGMLANGGSIALVLEFRTDTFWSSIEQTGTTCVILLGAMVNFIMKQPATDGERNTPLEHALIVPFVDDSVQFGPRFGVTSHTTFNMSEVSCPLVAEENPTVPHTCGTPRDGVEVRLVDGNDCEVPRGEIGELIVRTELPWALNHGYFGNPEATVEAWRNGWFHTGDAFRQDEQGNFFFVDRFKDAIRRRGENVSSFEVESEVLAHPFVAEAAAVAVPSELSEDEILIAVSLVDGTTLEWQDLVEFLVPRMAHFMVPRYYRVLPELPKTPTQKIEKYLIRREGVGADTWDREAAGIRIRRDRLT